MSTLIEKIASDEAIDAAYQWLCKKRRHYHPNADIWQLRRWWHEKKPILQGQILSGNFQFRELRLIRGEEKSIEWWSSLDALVLKAMTIVLTEHLKPVLSPRCFHLAGNGGLKGAVREVAAHVEELPFAFRTDVKGYYASINHGILMDIVGKYVQDDAVLCLFWGDLRRFVSDGGEYIDITQGISLGCPLSPLMGALFLKPLDDRMAALGCFYVRYMDYWVILAPTRWKLRKAIKATNQVMSELRVVKHPDKTFIGRVARGFDFLGYWFSPAGLGIARKTVERMVENMLRLYEQGAPDERIEASFQRWCRWVKGGIYAKWQGVIKKGGEHAGKVIESFGRAVFVSKPKRSLLSDSLRNCFPFHTSPKYQH